MEVSAFILNQRARAPRQPICATRHAAPPPGASLYSPDRNRSGTLTVDAPQPDSRDRRPARRFGLGADDLLRDRVYRRLWSSILMSSFGGQITLLARDANGDGTPDVRRVLLSGLDRPHGMDVHDGWLYVAESGAVGRVRFDATATA